MTDMFIDVGVATDAQDLLGDAIDALAADGWAPHDGDPEVVLLETIAPMAQNAAAVAAQVPPSIFRKFGTDLVNVPYKDGAPAETTSTWTLSDTDGHTIPAGTYVQVGDFYFATTADAVVAPGNDTVTAVALRALEDGSAANGQSGTGALVNSLAWVSSVTLEAPTAGGADAEDDPTYQNRLRSELTLIGPRPITAQDFADFAPNTPDVVVGRSTAFDGYDPFTNLLSANQASLETDTTGWAAGASTTIARTTAAHEDASAALSLTRTGSIGAAQATATAVAAQPGQTYTARADFMAAATARQCRVYLNFLNSAHALIGSAVAGVQVADAISGWAQATVTAVAPAGTAYVGVTVEVAAAAVSEVHYVDEISVKLVPFDQATNAVWTPGGVNPQGTPRTVTVAVTDVDGLALSVAAKTAIQAYLVSFREVNFVVHVIDSAYYTGADIAIAYTVKAYDGFDPAALIANINAKLSSLLSPKLYGQPQFGNQLRWVNDLVVRRNTLIGAIETVEGVKYVDTLTINGATADFTMNGPVALPDIDASSIVGTVI
jgi:hypothetical protein